MSKKFPRLYALSSTGKYKTWMIEAVGNIMVESWGYVDGKIQSQSKEIKGKNIGRANETTDEQQCELECQSKWQKKVDEQYTTSMGEVKAYADQDILLPMLAQKFQERKHNIVYPCFVQPKLNGVRCIYQNGKFMSRGGKEYTTLDHLVPELEKLGILIPDGEIYVHGMIFQRIVELVKKDRGPETDRLEYWIYDQVTDSEFYKRTENIVDAFGKHDFIRLHCVDTFEVNSEAEINKWHDKFVQDGFEGIIIRNRNGMYLPKVRSKDLQKLKNFVDEEFEIIGGKEADGADKGTVVFRVKDKKGNEFSVRPRGTRELRAEWWKNIDKLKGKNLTVRYQNLSKDGIPIFPVGVSVECSVRDYE